MKNSLMGLLVLITSSMAAHSQPTDRAIVNQHINCYAFNSNVKLQRTFGLTFDVQNRFVSGLSNMMHIARGGLEFYLSPRLSVVPVGYAYVWNYQYGKQPAAFANNEHRIWQNLNYKHMLLKRVGVHHRLRFEERLMQQHTREADGTIIDQGYSNHQFRIRYRFLANIPFNRTRTDPKTVNPDPKTLYASIWDEIFMSWGASVTYHQPDQNRFFAGLGYQITKDVAVQGGFFYCKLIKSNGRNQENNLGTLVQLNYNFPLAH
jgi:hypothetical protein